MSNTPPFTVEDLRVEPGRDQISGPAGDVHVEPLVMDVLVYLAQRAGVVVTREDLIESVWEGYPGADQSLTNAASKLRQAFEQVGGDRELLDTVPKRGYRLDASVKSIEPEAGRRPSRFKFAGSLAAVLLALAAVLFALYWPSGQPDRRPRLAVLPMENLGPVEEDHLAAGLTEEITTRLASIHELGVISRTSTLQYAGDAKDIRTIAGELDVDYILEGSIRWQDESAGKPGRIRIATQLIRASDDTHLWANIYDRPLQDVFEVQAEIARAVAGELGKQLTASSAQDDSKATPTDNLAAYQAYLLGLDYAYPTKQGSEFVSRAYAAFHLAVELDPDFAEAWAELCLVALSWEWDRGGIGIPEVTPGEALERAMALAPESPSTLIAAGWYYMGGEEGPRAVSPGSVGKAIDAFSSALKARPDDVRALVGLGRALLARGDFEAGVEFLEAALIIGPRNPDALRQARIVHSDLGHFERADKINDRLLEIEPYFWHHWYIEAYLKFVRTQSLNQAREVLERAPPNLPPLVPTHLEIMAGEFGSVRERTEKLLERIPFSKLDRGFSGFASYAYRQLGDDDMAERLGRHFREIMLNYMRNAPDDWAAVIHSAQAEALLGNEDAALRYARRAVEMTSGRALTHLNSKFILAQVAALLGKEDMVFDILEELSERGVLFQHQLRFEGAFRAFDGNPRFAALLATVPESTEWRPKPERPISEMLASIKLQPVTAG